MLSGWMMIACLGVPWRCEMCVHMFKQIMIFGKDTAIVIAFVWPFLNTEFLNDNFSEKLDFFGE